MSDSQPKAPSRRKFLKTMGISAGSTAMLAGLNQSASAQSSEPVKIGCPAPLTGIVAADGIEFRRGLEMAAEEINAVGGILGRPVELVFVDTESKGDDVVIQAAQRLIDRDKASALVLGYNLETGTALHDVAADSGIVAMHSIRWWRMTNSSGRIRKNTGAFSSMIRRKPFTASASSTS